MRIEDFIRERDKLTRQIQELYRMANRVGNHHCYELRVGGELVQTERWSPSREVIDAIVKEIHDKAKIVEAELALHESRISIR